MHHTLELLYKMSQCLYKIILRLFTKINYIANNVFLFRYVTFNAVQFRSGKQTNSCL